VRRPEESDTPDPPVVTRLRPAIRIDACEPPERTLRLNVMPRPATTGDSAISAKSWPSSRIGVMSAFDTLRTSEGWATVRLMRMTSLGSGTTDLIGTALVVIGVIGFGVCWHVGWTAQERVLGTHRFERPTAATPSAIEMKGSTFFVERDYARHYRTANSLIFAFWSVGALGAGLRERKRIGDRWKRRRWLRMGPRGSSRRSID